MGQVVKRRLVRHSILGPVILQRSFLSKCFSFMMPVFEIYYVLEQPNGIEFRHGPDTKGV